MIRTVKGMGLCDFTVLFLYGLSFCACLLDFFKASLLEIPFFYNYQGYSLLPLSGLIPFFSGVFSLFMFLYSRQYSSVRNQFTSAFFIVISLMLNVFSTRFLQPEQVILISTFSMIIPVALLLMYSKINEKNKINDIQNV